MQIFLWLGTDVGMYIIAVAVTRSTLATQKNCTWNSCVPTGQSVLRLARLTFLCRIVHRATQPGMLNSACYIVRLSTLKTGQKIPKI